MSEATKFTQDILTNAKAKADSIIREAEAETQRASDEAKIAIQREADAIARAGRSDAEAIKRREISEARHRSKLRQQREKDRIMQEVLDETKKRTFEIVRDDSRYIPLLTRLVESGINELGTELALIHLNGTDLKRVAILERNMTSSASGRVKVEWSKEPIDALGGVIVSSRDGRIRIVNTLDQKFNAVEPKLLIEARKSLFGE